MLDVTIPQKEDEEWRQEISITETTHPQDNRRRSKFDSNLHQTVQACP
jgi:hypothetical protein